MIKHVDSGGQVHLVTNIRKPRKWRRYEYLQSNGNLWIDTGFIPNNDTKVILDFKQNAVTDGFFFGGRDAYSGSACFALHKDYAQFGSDMGPGCSVGNSLNRCTVILSLDGIYIDSTLKHSYSSMSFTSPKTLKLFGCELSSGMYSNKASMTAYSFKVYNSNTLVRDFVPAQYNGQYGMWDLVEDRFYPNKGTGTFTVGPEIKNYDEIYEVRKTYSILPSGVELYDYILNSGQQWLNTGLVANSNTKVECKFKSDITSPVCIYGSTIDSLIGFRLFWLGGYLYAASGGNRALNTMTPSTSTIYTTVHSYNSLKVNDTSYTTTSGNGFGDNITLMHDPYSASYYFCGKFYYCKIWDGNTLVRNFLPCTYLGEPGMWDTVENKFYRNQGTGLFTLGNRITLKEYEYLLSDATAYIDTNVYLSKSVDYSLNVELLEIPVNADYQGINWLCQLQTLADTSKVIYTYDINNKLNSAGTFIETSTRNGLNFPTAYRNWTSISANSGNVYLFKFNYGSNPYLVANRKIYYCKIKLDNQLVRDFIPVSYNGTPGLWDKVEWKFYANAGSGSFTLGPEKKSGIYPVWTPIEYLLSDNNSYINTNYVPNGNTRVITDIMILDSNSQNKGIFGSFPTNTWADRSYALYLYSSNNLWNNYNNDKNLGSSYYSIMLNNITHIDKNKNVLYINNEIAYQDTKVTFNSNVPMHIFRINKPTVLYSKFKLYYFKIYDDDVLVRDFIPIRIGTTGALYDKVEGKVYFNSGTGNFILGPDL